MENAKPGVHERFINEKIGSHWSVDSSPESFDRLINHISIYTNFKSFFEQGLAHPGLFSQSSGLIAADIGAGVAWTSAVMALKPEICKVYVVEPSQNRLKSAEKIAGHFEAPLKKMMFIDGTFEEPRVPEKVHIVSLCASLHHCFDEGIPGLFKNIRDMLIPGKGVVLITNEHYITNLTIMARKIKWMSRFHRRHLMEYGPGNWYPPTPLSGDHWRTKKELDTIFRKEGFSVEYYPQGNLAGSASKWGLKKRLGWVYYYAVLRPLK